MFRGEFVGLNGSADFYADSVSDLRKEGRLSLRIFLEECERLGIQPSKSYSGKFQVRLPAEIHEHAVDAANARGAESKPVCGNRHRTCDSHLIPTPLWRGFK
ncbi:type II toxin-antitoxin system HicB family antitoxin [Vreelandella sulfidaeris]